MLLTIDGIVLLYIANCVIITSTVFELGVVNVIVVCASVKSGVNPN